MPQPPGDKDARLRKRGAEYGLKWAQDADNGDAVERLSIGCTSFTGGLEMLVPVDEHSAGKSYERVANLIAGRTLRSQPEVKSVWADALGGEVEPSLSEPWFLRGFLEGAVGVRFTS